MIILAFIYLYPKVNLSNDELENTLTIIFLGGKTTLINSFVNFIIRY